MYGALSTSKGAKGTHAVSFVGTTNPQHTKYISDCKVGLKEKGIPIKILE